MLNIYRGKKVLITGSTGFKGSWLALMLKVLGAEVCGAALPPVSSPSLFTALNLAEKITQYYGDIVEPNFLAECATSFQPEIIFHLAAQALVRPSFADPVGTYQTNVIGTLRALEAARHTPAVRAFVNITSDKCYENRETTTAYTEDDSLGGLDIYSSSKACAEILSSSYRRSFPEAQFLLATLRAGNVIGGGDWGAERLIPDGVRAWSAGQILTLRRPFAVRPWQHVLEPLYGYLLLGAKLLCGERDFAEPFNLGPDNCHLSVEEVASILAEFLPGLEIRSEPDHGPSEAGLLFLNSAKAKERLGWSSGYDTRRAVELTASWYQDFYSGKDMLAVSIGQIENYLADFAKDYPRPK